MLPQLHQQPLPRLELVTERIKHDIKHPHIHSNVTLFQVICLGTSLGFIVLSALKAIGR
jgi:hypothetical protein